MGRSDLRGGDRAARAGRLHAVLRGAARPCGEVWCEGLWETIRRRLTEEDERVLDEVNRQRRAHAASQSHSEVTNLD